ncbi:hypothetical protein COB21_05230 [Candidatus Aerophobetes bacterium]|uniref:HTH luxR-type domain-containing protein n=1 Tax=Aerophobetes bacterium TaxID=2030807 RepID=A0A2A4WZP8_UNCAE|nr:MAG: hypothetical protein COB21_05230 [Candidatus Aerophobetes bacterium]
MSKALVQICSDFVFQSWEDASVHKKTSIYDLFSENAIINTPLFYQVGPESLKQSMAGGFQAFPDATFIITKVHDYERNVTCKWAANATHLGDFNGVNPTKKKVCICGETSFIFNQENQVVHYIATLNMNELLTQLGQQAISHKQSPQDLLISNVKPLITSLQNYYNTLTAREFECCSLFISGFSAKQIGLMLSISHRTVETYLEKVRFTLSCTSRIQMIEKFLSEQTYFILQDLARLLTVNYSTNLLL